MGDKKYIITEKELEQLIKDSQELAALGWAGVDNWEGYEEAMEEYDEDGAVDFSGYQDFEETLHSCKNKDDCDCREKV
jgi:hypothetical protein